MNLTGAQKAALVILGLSEDVAALVLRQMEEDDLRLLAQAVEKYEPLNADLLEPALEEFERELAGPVLPHASSDYVRKLTIQALGPDRASRVFSPPVIPPAAIERLRAARPQVLADMLREEHPQVAAAVVSQLPPDRAAEVLLAMPDEDRVDALRRITSIEEIPERAVAIASEALAESLAAATSDDGEGREFDGLAFAASVINQMPAEDSDRTLERLEELDADLVPKIREAMFTFEDLSRLDKRSLQALMREVSSEQMLIALKTASDELREVFLGAVSKRAAESMREDLELMPPKRLSEVEAAQRQIIDTAMQLAADGKISMPGNGEEMV
ncbi:MAG: flagellar motor switch protein FliG [Deltaproteobacteria bacterium]|nr:MAG: flagellar motor switch protein FliG [Deltaproteobacteria bacterium]